MSLRCLPLNFEVRLVRWYLVKGIVGLHGLEIPTCLLDGKYSSCVMSGHAAIQFEFMIELDNRDTFRAIVDVFDVELIAPDLADMSCVAWNN